MGISAAVKRIAVGVDGSEHADAAIDWAIRMAPKKPASRTTAQAGEALRPGYVGGPGELTMGLDYLPEWALGGGCQGKTTIQFVWSSWFSCSRWNSGASPRRTSSWAAKTSSIAAVGLTGSGAS
jgi:hypothetical protein